MAVGQLIGIVAAGGAVGAEAAAAVSELGLPVRLGARRHDALAAARRRCAGPADLVRLDVSDPDRLSRFCAGCEVVVNCAATDAVLRATVAAAALASGAHYVDPGGDEGFRARLAAVPGLAVRAAVLAAGAQPGLTALVPRWLAAQDLEPPFALTVYTVTMDRMTRGAAEEFLLSLGEERPGPAGGLAARRAGPGTGPDSAVPGGHADRLPLSERRGGTAGPEPRPARG